PVAPVPALGANEASLSRFSAVHSGKLDFRLARLFHESAHHSTIRGGVDGTCRARGGRGIVSRKQAFRGARDFLIAGECARSCRYEINLYTLIELARSAATTGCAENPR